MAEYKVLITTSGTGSRLGDITKYTNKSLVRVGDKPAISHIIESYPKSSTFVITIGYYGQHIKDFLELAYPDRKFEFVEVDNYDGEGSSLLYSLLCAKKKLNCPFIFHVGDAIIKNHSFEVDSFNWVVGYKKHNSSQYRTFNVNGGTVTKFNEKGELNHDYVYVGVSGIFNYKEFWEKLEDIYSTDKLNGALSDVHVLREMITTTKFKYVEVDNWNDIGNSSELQKTRSKFKSTMNVLDKIDENIFMFDEFIIKFFYNKEISKNRFLRGKLLNGVVPEVVELRNNFFKYTKSEGTLFSESVNPIKFQHFLDWLDKNLWKTKEANIELLNKKFYFDKTNSRINDFKKQIKETDKTINGIKIPEVTDILDKVNFNKLYEGKPYQIHGDLILDNVIETDSGFRLIDWRQDFGGELNFGDIYYDLAKLNHNLIFNHYLVESGHFKITENNENITCDILLSKNLMDCRDILHKFIISKGFDLKKVKILTALVWLNMSPLHEYPINKFLFNFGKYNLYRELKK